MSRFIFSPLTAVEAGVSHDPPAAVHGARHRTLTPGQRIIDGRNFYSAAWLDQATGTRSEFPRLKRGRDASGERSAGDALERGADRGPTRVEG